MKDITKNLCKIAADINESKKFSSDKIFELLINSKSRLKEVSRSKQLVSYFLYNNYNFTLTQIAKELNMKNHTSIMHHIDNVFYGLRTDKRAKYRHDFMLDVMSGLKRTIIRNKTISRNELSDDDKKFIDENSYNVSYYSDVLTKNKGVISLYLKNIHKENKARYKNQMLMPKISFNKIDY
jgi:hypothetical protein